MRGIHRCALVMVAMGVGLALSGAPLTAQHEHHGGGATAAPQPVTGQVLSGEDGAPLAGAVVQLFHMMGEVRHLMAGVLTGDDGRFAVRMEPGSYVAEITHLGHETERRPVRVEGSAVSLGEVRLRTTALRMEGITVRAARDEIRVRNGATVVDAATATAAGGSVDDLLRTVPGLEVDPDGTVTIRGSAALVLVNGRRTPLEGAALISFLRQLPAGALDRIEAGTAASARQDADGGGGVVNLVFREHGGTTDLRSISASAGTEDHYRVSGAATGSLGAAVDWDATYSFSSMRPGTESGMIRESLVAGDPVALAEQRSDARAHHRLHSVLGGATTRLTPTLSLSGRGSFSWMEGEFDNTTRFEDTGRDGRIRTRTTGSLLEHTIPSGDGALTLGWVGGADGRVRLSSEVSGSAANEEFLGDYVDGAGATFLATAMDTRHREYRLRNDATLEAAGIVWELGHASRVRTIDAEYGSTATGPASAPSFGYTEEIHAGYLSGRGTLGDLRVELGVRVENDRTTVEWDRSRTDDALRLFPTVLVEGPAGAGDRLRWRAAASRRINRPESAHLNPYSLGEDDMNMVVGNPALRPELVDQVEIGIERHGARSVLQVTPFLRLTRDPIRPLKAVTESGQATTTLHNLARTLAAGADASVRARLGSRLTATLSGSAYHLSTEGLSYQNDGVNAVARLTVDVRVTDRTTVQLYGYRRGAQAIEQGEILPNATSELALTHRWGADQRGRLTLRISDPFRSDDLAFRVREPAFVQESQRRISRPLASVFVSWAVGGRPEQDTGGHTGDEEPTIF